MLPTISTRTCSHVGAVKPSLKGSIHSASLAGTSRLELPSRITPPNRRPGETRPQKISRESGARSHWIQRQANQKMAKVQLRANPNSSRAIGINGTFLIFDGKPLEARDALLTALHLNPRDTE